MNTKFRTFIVICIVFLLTFVIGRNLGFVVLSQENGSNNASGTKPYLRSSGNYYWSPIEVISEPIKGNDFNNQSSRYPRIVVEDNKIFTVWSDSTNLSGSGLDSDIFYRYFDGNQWSQIQIISEPVMGSNINNGASNYPDIAVENGKIYVVWWDYTDWYGAEIDSDIFYRYFDGNQWSQIQIISEPVVSHNFNTGSSYEPKVAVENGKIYVVWHDNNDTNGAFSDYDVFYRCNLTGSGWEDIQVISEPSINKNFNIANSNKASMAIENEGIFVVWQDENNTNSAGTDSDIFYRCNLTGSSWEDIQVISEPVFGQNNNNQGSGFPEIDVENGKIYIVWQDGNNTNGAGNDWDIFCRCNLTGSSWEDIQVISEPSINKDINTAPSQFPAMAVEDDVIYIIWSDNNDTSNSGGDPDIFFMYNNSGKWSEVEVISEPVLGLNFDIGANDNNPPAIAVNHGKSYIVWCSNNDTDSSGTDWDIHYRCTKFLPPVLFQDRVMPTYGNTSVWFNYTVTYADADNDAPIYVKASINGTNYTMIELDTTDNIYFDGKFYYYNFTGLDIGVHTYQFWTNDGFYTIFSLLNNKPEVYNTPPNITVENNLTAIEDTYYEVNYDYKDIDIENVGQKGYWDFSTNASWLLFDNATAILNGTPTNDDVGQYWVNITINDTMDIDFTNFTLIVIDVNDNPIINTSNIEITYEDKLYEVDYNATDIDSPFEKQIWSLETNASSWLSIDSVMGIVSGTPVNDDVGNYWVNISIDDGEAGKDYTNFTLIVMNVNDPPVIVTANLQTTMTGKLYKVDYNATDIDPTNDTLSWSLATNASWLSIDSFTGILSGIPTTNDFGRFDLNVTVDDGNSGLDWTEFILTVEKGPTEYNEPPLITTIDRVSAAVDVLYKVDYDATDDRTPIDLLTWELVTNASWLSITSSIGVLTGTPTSNDLGWYWVNVSVNDDEGKSDFHNFTLTVFSTANLPPEIITEDIRYAIVDILYSVDYDATDDRTPVAYLQWSLTTNASWLNITPTTGVLSGTPRISNVGWYTVSVFVNDSEDGWDYHDFIITVTTEPISENKAPKLSYPKLNPSDGDAETEFTFSVHYYDEDGDAPTFIRVIIDNESYDMILSHDNPSNGTYQYCTKLSEGTHTYYFIASDGVDIVETGKFTTSSIDKGKDKISNEDFFWIWLILIVVVIIIVLILLFIFLKKKKGKEEESPVEEAPPEVPPEQPPTPEITPEQPPTPEIPPEQPSAPETLPPEQPPAVTQPSLGQQSLAPTVTVTEPQMPQIEPPPAPPQPVMQPTVTPQIIPTITQPPVTEPPASDEELEE